MHQIISVIYQKKIWGSFAKLVITLKMRQKKPIPVSGSIFACFVCDLMNLLTTLINQFVGYQRIDVFISFISLNENMVK